MAEFITQRKRDAWGPIRGYVYQVDLTIERWLDLQPDAALELERGEDIDTIQEAMLKSGDEQEQGRLLEQIKARDSKLTLRSPQALESLASFYEHLSTNPTLHLSFRYVTNAQIGVEQNSPMPDKTPLVTLWNNLRTKSIEGPEKSAALRAIRGFLATANRPKDLAEVTWNRFVNFINSVSEEDLLSFISKVEWLTHYTPMETLGRQIQQVLVDDYKVTPEEAQVLYSLLFLHVFKLLSRPGIKRLTASDRDALVTAPYLDRRDSALLENLKIYFTNLSERVGALEEAVKLLQQRPLPTASEIREACRKATTRLARVLIDNQKIIERENFKDGIDEFLSSALRYCFVLGPSGVGKSISIAMEAERLVRQGRIVLLIPGKYFSLEEAARLITQELSPPAVTLPWQKIVELLTQDDAAEPPAFVLFIDAIDEADEPNQLSLQLTKLHDSIGATPPEKFKVVLSCRDIVWSRFSQQHLTPLYEDFGPLPTRVGRRSGYAGRSVWLSDFTTDELDRALREIDATELLNPGRFGGAPSAHIATVRDLLKHPATFEHYSALRQTSDSLSIQDITWSYLIEERLRKALDKAARRSGKSAAELRRMLERLAVLGRENNSKVFQLSVEAVREAIPEIEEESAQAAESPLMALIENGLLQESTFASQRMIGFRITDMAAYLLSFELERQSDGRTSQEFRGLVTQWLNDSWNFPPLLDAVLAWIDRLADRPYSSRAVLFIDVMVQSHHFRNGQIFGLMRPEILKTIFEIVKRENLEHFYAYHDAALKVRPSPVMLEEVRRHLKDENTLARQLAAELAGAHQDELANEELIKLLQDADKDVRRKAYKAFSYIGKSAISPLLETIRDTSQPVELRGSCITALRGVGFRDAEVSAALSQSLHEGASSSPELLERALLTAAHLRDKGHAEIAVAALKNQQTIENAAKYLTEVPDSSAFPALRESLDTQTVPESERATSYWVLSQLMAALFNTDKTQAEPILLEIFRKGLQGIGELPPIRAVQIADKFDIAALRPVLLEFLIKQLIELPERNLVWDVTKTLGATWRVDHLDAMIDKNDELARQGTDIAKLFVDLIIPGIQISEEFPLGNRLNRVSDLLTVAKCQADNFASEVGRLLSYSGVLGCIELCRLLWVVGDSRAEESLLHRMENPSSEREARQERSDTARALGTCGTRRGAEAVLSYLRTDGDEISLYFHRETLYPLLVRGVISAEELISVVRDAQMPWASRTVSLLALGITDASAYKDVFAEIAESPADDERLPENAVRMLGFTKDKSVIPLLRRLLAASDSLSVKSQAAECLAWLDDNSVVHEIERALEDSHASEFVTALAHFGESTSLPVLLERLRSSSFDSRRDYLEALGAFWKYPQGRAAILEQFDRWSSSEERFLNNQSALIEGLVDHEPDVILDQFNRSFDDGHLTTAARETMSQMLVRLFYRRTSDETLLLETAKRLVCDRHVPARERAAHALEYASPVFCTKLFESLHDSAGADEWQRSCAVYTLGFWESDMNLMEDARYDGELLVRRAADAALSIRLKKSHLRKHIERFKSDSGLTRLSSYLCLSEQGYISSIWSLYDDDKYQPRSLALTFRRSLSDRIQDRLRKEHREKEEEEKKQRDSRGMITFD